MLLIYSGPNTDILVQSIWFVHIVLQICIVTALVETQLVQLNFAITRPRNKAMYDASFLHNTNQQFNRPSLVATYWRIHADRAKAA